MNRAAVDWACRVVLVAPASARDPDAVLLLLRAFVASGDDDLREAVERGLTHAVEAGAIEADPFRRLHWLRLLSAASPLSDDTRLAEALARQLPAAIDAIEGLVRRSYEPGEGLLGRGCAEHLRCAWALLAAFDLSGRLPYGMLAEELLQHARRQWWRHQSGDFDADLAANCIGLRLLCRLASLHADPDYLAAAVVAPTRPYGTDARRLADVLIGAVHAEPAHAAVLGSALQEWFAFAPELQ